MSDLLGPIKIWSKHHLLGYALISPAWGQGNNIEVDGCMSEMKIEFIFSNDCALHLATLGLGW